jgi:methylated-DNA-[protein]-cysteine S-methyltransferase
MKPIIYVNLLQTKMLGGIGVAVTEMGLLRLRMFQESIGAFLEMNAVYQDGEYQYSEEDTKEVLEQLEAYLAYERKTFNLPIDWSGYTDFQRSVLEKTLAIPYGETRSYGEIASAVGSPRAFRAVGQAEKRNQVPLIIPCHRVIGSDGSLTGYGGKENIDLKARLLDFEKEGLKRGIL